MQCAQSSEHVSMSSSRPRSVSSVHSSSPCTSYTTNSSGLPPIHPHWTTFNDDGVIYLNNHRIRGDIIIYTEEISQEPSCIQESNPSVNGPTVLGRKKAKLTQPIKIAAFDVDGTITQCRSHNVLPHHYNDWEWYVHPDLISRYKNDPAKQQNEAKHILLERMQEYHDLGYELIFITNQLNSTSTYVHQSTHNNVLYPEMSRVELLKHKFFNVLAQIGLPVSIYMLNNRDGLRKPHRGTWDLILDNLQQMVRQRLIDQGVSEVDSIDFTELVDVSSCFYVGDAAGRKDDHSSADYAFALNVFGYTCINSNGSYFCPNFRVPECVFTPFPYRPDYLTNPIVAGLTGIDYAEINAKHEDLLKQCQLENMRDPYDLLNQYNKSIDQIIANNPDMKDIDLFPVVFTSLPLYKQITTPAPESKQSLAHVIMLSGPPSAGKTTLAQTIKQHFLSLNTDKSSPYYTVHIDSSNSNTIDSFEMAAVKSQSKNLIHNKFYQFKYAVLSSPTNSRSLGKPLLSTTSLLQSQQLDESQLLPTTTQFETILSQLNPSTTNIIIIDALNLFNVTRQPYVDFCAKNHFPLHFVNLTTDVNLATHLAQMRYFYSKHNPQYAIAPLLRHFNIHKQAPQQKESFSSNNNMPFIFNPAFIQSPTYLPPPSGKSPVHQVGNDFHTNARDAIKINPSFIDAHMIDGLQTHPVTNSRNLFDYFYQVMERK